MAKKAETLSYQEAWRRNYRAFRMGWEKYPNWYRSCLLKGIFSAAAPYVTIYISARIINELAGQRRPGTLVSLVLTQVISAAVLALANGILTRWHSREAAQVNYQEKKILTDKNMDMDFVDLDSQRVSDLLYQIAQNANWMGWGVIRVRDIFEGFVTALTQIIGGVALALGLFLRPVPAGSRLAFLNHPLFILLVLVLLLGVALLGPSFANKAENYWNGYADMAKLVNRQFSAFSGKVWERKLALDQRIYSQSENIFTEKMKANDGFGPNSWIARKARGPMGLLYMLSAVLSVVMTGLVYLFVCLKAWAGAFGVGSITQYVGAINNLFLGISTLIQKLGDMRANATFLEPYFDLLDTPNNMYQGSLTTEKRNDRQYEVEFPDVSIQYPGSDTYALRHVNMKFRVGSRLAVVGMNGSGKTTFIKLLCRLYDPTEGEILLNGIDIRKYRYHEYMDIFSVVFQDFKLLALPLGQNVAGTVDYDQSRVLDSLEKAGFSDRLAELSKGLDTSLYKELDAEGVEVSGGEAQKIAIARALYKDAPFIILDEPTAALDPMAEAEIYSRFNDIAGDKTAIYISHRLSSCKFCDEIAVFDHGQVIQKGTHESLVADEGGKYYELWNAQAQYYTEETSD